jgi:hypothetical protein
MGREDVVGTQSPDSASLQAGLFSLLPSGKRTGASPFRQGREPASALMNIHAIALKFAAPATLNFQEQLFGNEGMGCSIPLCWIEGFER